MSTCLPGAKQQDKAEVGQPEGQHMPVTSAGLRIWARSATGSPNAPLAAMQASASSSLMRSAQRSRACVCPRSVFPGPIAIGAAARRLPPCVASSSASAPANNVEEPTSHNQPSMLQALRQHVSKAKSHMSTLPSYVASAVVVAGGNGELYGALSKAMEIYLVLLTVRVLMSWFRNVNWNREPFNLLRQFTDPYLNMFRGIIPPLGGMDLSPMLGFLILSWSAKQLKRMSFGF